MISAEYLTITSIVGVKILNVTTIEESNGQAGMERCLHVNTWKTSCANSIHSYVSATPTS
jgi:hypothetical protein